MADNPYNIDSLLAAQQDISSYNFDGVTDFNTSYSTPSIQDNYMQAQTDWINSSLADKNSFWGAGGQFDTFAGNFGKVMGGVSSLANLYLGFKQLDMAEDALNIKKDQWKEAKNELNHMRGVRDRINKSYTTGAAVPR